MHMSTKLQTHQCPVKVIIFQSNSNIMTDLLTQTDMWWTDLILRVGYGIFNSRYDDLETLDWFHDSLIKQDQTSDRYDSILQWLQTENGLEKKRKNWIFYDNELISIATYPPYLIMT